MSTLPDNPNTVEGRRVFISCTTLDLRSYRKVATEVINTVSANFEGRFALTPVSMDTQGQDGEPRTPLDVSRAWVRNKSDWVVLIVAWNYGYVPDGAPCSVTESEHLTAFELGKKCFVFIAGEPADPPENRYRALDDQFEPENLSDFRGKVANPQHQKLLDDFKTRLRLKRCDLFRNIEDFRAKLTRSLNQRIISELFRTMGPDIVRLELLKPLRSCLDEVKLLAQLKRLHDTLHRIRQYGIRSWREELVASWPDDGGKPPPEAREKYFEGTIDIIRLIERVGNFAYDLPSAVRQTLLPLEKVISYELPKIRETSKGDFIESIEGFASRVQRLFTGCDTEMGASASRLDRCYSNLADSTRRALDKKRVAASQESLLRTELDRSMQIHLRMQQVLLNHRRWQQIHDEFERIDSAIENETPHHDEETRTTHQRNFLFAAADLIDAGGTPVKALLAAATEIVTQDHQERLQQWPGLILAVGTHLDRFLQQTDVEHFGAMRKHFDDLFFQIDLETRVSVERAEDRVRAIDSGLQDRPTQPGDL